MALVGVHCHGCNTLAGPIIAMVSPSGVSSAVHAHLWLVPQVSRALGGGSRREISHSAFVRSALGALMPDRDDFAFTVRVNTDALASNGSSASAAICGASLALADAGVPIRDLVAGVSIGLASQPDSAEGGAPHMSSTSTVDQWLLSFHTQKLVTSDCVCALTQGSLSCTIWVTLCHRRRGSSCSAPDQGM